MKDISKDLSVPILKGILNVLHIHISFLTMTPIIGHRIGKLMVG